MLSLRALQDRAFRAVGSDSIAAICPVWRPYADRRYLTAAPRAGSWLTAAGDADAGQGGLTPTPASTDLARRVALVPRAIKRTFCGRSGDPRQGAEGDSCRFPRALNTKSAVGQPDKFP